MSGVFDRLMLSIPLFLILGCSADMDKSSFEYADLISTFDFETADQQWTGGISDYPSDYKDSSDFVVRNSLLAYSSLYDGNELSISAENPYGEIFYFFKRKIEGLEPNTEYKLDFEFLISSQLTSGVKLGDSEDVYLKIGAVDYEPFLEKVKLDNAQEYVMLNVDKGASNSGTGDDLTNIGSIRDFTGEKAEAISGHTFDTPIRVRTDGHGVIWLVIGVDSGIKNRLTFGMSAVTVYYSEILG